MNDAVPLTSGETYFFRDHGQFDLLRLCLLPELIARRGSQKTLRLWSAGCASGEEAYSLAMLVDMLLPERNDWNIVILGNDINLEALEKARRARYGQWSFRMVSPSLQQRFFRREGDEWELDERIRRMVTFRNGNLINDTIPDTELRDMDLILCRNVFIYFKPDAVMTVATKLAAALSAGGYLVTGHTELIGHRVQNLQTRLFAEGVVYQRVNQAPATHAPLLSPPLREGEVVMAQKGKGVKAPPLARTFPPISAFPHERGKEPNAPSITRRTGEGWDGDEIPADLVEKNHLTEARELADRGEYILAEQVCRKVLDTAPLAAEPHFLLAQLAQLRGDFGQAAELLNKTLYLAPRCVAAYLELAALCERAEDIPRAQTLRRAALNILRSLPGDEVIEPYETTAGELAQWLTQS